MKKKRLLKLYAELDEVNKQLRLIAEKYPNQPEVKEAALITRSSEIQVKRFINKQLEELSNEKQIQT